MNRREFIGLGAAALAGCAAPKAVEMGKGRVRPGLRLGMAGFTYKKRGVDSMLKEMEKLEIRYLCVKDFHLPYTATDVEIREFVRKCADSGVTPYGVGPVPSKTIDQIRMAFDFAKRLGAGVIVGSPYKVGKSAEGKDLLRNRELCEQISPLCDEYDIRFAIHNHGPDQPLCYPTGEVVCEFVKDLSPRMGMCLDIGHDYRSGSDPAVCIRRFRDRLFDLHLKDIRLHAGDSKADAMILGRGVLDLPAVVKALCDVGYGGCCSIEYETNFDDNFGDIAESVGYFKALVRLAEKC